MTPRRECEFFLLRYVPDPVRNEFVHVGVILRERAGMQVETAVRFTRDWRRVRCLDPEADTEMLEGLESELRRRFEAEAGGDGSEAGNLMRLVEDSFSNSVQVTRGKAYLAESIPAGVEELMRLYVEPMKRERVSRVSGRAAIQTQMRVEFERAGVWDLMRKRIEAAMYTRAGDPLRIDLGYRAGRDGDADRAIRMFQAVSLGAMNSGAASGMASGMEMAKVLAFSAPALRAGVERLERAALELTAVVEPVRQGSGIRGQGAEVRDQGPGARDQAEEMDAEWLASYRFAVETMEEHGIRVLTTLDLGRAAETARREMAV